MKKLHVIAFLLITLFLRVYADLRLEIEPYRQWGVNTCWAAVCVMVFNAYSMEQADEKRIRCWAVEDKSDCDTKTGGETDIIMPITGQWRAVDQILMTFEQMPIFSRHIAHDIHIKDSEFESYASAEFFTGGNLVISDGVNVKKGAHVIFRSDPSYW